MFDEWRQMSMNRMNKAVVRDRPPAVRIRTKWSVSLVLCGLMDRRIAGPHADRSALFAGLSNGFAIKQCGQACLTVMCQKNVSEAA